MTALLLVALALAGPLPAQVFELDPSTGSLRAILYKEGLLKAFGHDHVVQAGSFSGSVEVAGGSSSARVELRAEDLVADDPRARSEEGLRGRVSKKDRARIRETMLGPKGLEAERYPLIAFRSTAAVPDESQGGRWRVRGDLSFHGRTRTVDALVAVSETPEGVWFSADLPLRLGDWGLEPFSAAGGLVRVKDGALLRVRVLGRRPGP